MFHGKPNAEDRVTDPAADMEPDHSHASDEALSNGLFDQAVRIHIHSIRARTVDADGLSAKAVIDGVVAAGVIRDDAPAYVQAVTFSQEQGTPERTIITVSAGNE